MVCICLSVLNGQVIIQPPTGVLRPNLVITEFTVTNQGLQSGDFMKYTFRLKIQNNGGDDITIPFYFTVQFKTENMTTFNMTDNHYKILRLNAGQNYVMNETFSLNTGYVSGKTVEVRGYIDSGGDREMPPSYRDVMESNENDNYSDAVTIGGAYTPNIASIKPEYPVNALKIATSTRPSNEKVRIDGMGFGSSQGAHTVALFPFDDINNPQTVNITSWSGGVIYFTIPVSLKSGKHLLAIVDKNTMEKKSNILTVYVCVRRERPWAEVVKLWDVLKDAFKLRLHTWGGKAIYENQSTMTIIGRPDTIEVDEIKLTRDTGRYRYYINDFNAKRGGISLHLLSLDKVRLLDNELRMQVLFESKDLEVKGYFQALGSKSWKDHGAPDLDIDNAMLSVTFSFVYKNQRLDYDALSVYFKGDIDARDPAADWFMDLFAKEWDDQIVNKIEDDVSKSFFDPEQRQKLCASLLGFIINVGTARYAEIVDIEFTNKDVLVTYYMREE